jgi:hypothetical protein
MCMVQVSEASWALLAPVDLALRETEAMDVADFFQDPLSAECQLVRTAHLMRHIRALFIQHKWDSVRPAPTNNRARRGPE